MADDTVQRYWNMFGTMSSTKVAAVGFPDFFVYKICEGYLFWKDMEIEFVEGNGNCLPTSIIKQLHFDKDPGGDLMYTQMYLQRAVIMHLIALWDLIGSDISENIKYSYGHPDSEVGGLKLKKVTGKGKTCKEHYGFSMKDWCLYILRDGSWCDEIFIKLVASLWRCRISVLQADNLSAITYRYEGSYDEAEITLMYNGNPTRGHYSPVRCTWTNLQFEANDIEHLSFSPNYRKEIDLDKRLNRRDTIWNLDDEKTQKRIFNKKRGYMFVQEDKAEDKEKKEATKVIDEGLLIGKDEMIVKKTDYKALVKIGEEVEEKDKRIAELEKRGTAVGEDEVVMKKKEFEEKDKRIEELEKHGRAVGEDEVIIKKQEVKVMMQKWW